MRFDFVSALVMFEAKCSYSYIIYQKRIINIKIIKQW